MKLVEVTGTIPAGSYPAVCSGYVSEFKVNGQTYRAKFKIGVRGINIQDTVTVTPEGITSQHLGANGIIV